jgi:hypothetical protein
MQARHSTFYGAMAALPLGTQAFATWESEVSQLFGSIGKLQEAALLPTVGQDLDEINILVNSLAADLESVRQRGYAHQAQLDAQVADLVSRWDRLYESVAEMLLRRQTELVDGANRLLDHVDLLYQPGATRDTVNSCWAGVRALQQRVEAAHQSLVGMYDGLSAELGKIETILARTGWMLDQVEAAKFRLLQGEGPLRAASARWIRDAKGAGESGILFLTDQRVLFEQNEQRITEKFLFIALKRETLHVFRYAFPVSGVLEVQTGPSGSSSVGRSAVESLFVRLDETGPYPSVRFELTHDQAQTWKELIGRVRSREIDNERTKESVTRAEAMDLRIGAMPAHCPSCSAPVDHVVLRGMTEVQCRYCGRMIRW